MAWKSTHEEFDETAGCLMMDHCASPCYNIFSFYFVKSTRLQRSFERINELYVIDNNMTKPDRFDDSCH